MEGINPAQLPFRGLSHRRRPCRGPDAAEDQARDPALRHLRMPVEPNDRLTIVYGHPLVSRVVLNAAADRAVAGEPVVFLDGAQTFDPFVVGQLAKARRQQPRKVLAMIHVARVFSSRQMERLLSNCLAGALDRYQARTAVISGLFETLADDTASDRDIVRIADRLLESLRLLTRQGYTLLVPCPARPMPATPGDRLFTGLRPLADRMACVREVPGQEGRVTFEEDTRVADAV